MILDEKKNTELAASSNTIYHEVLMEKIDFVTTECDEEVTIMLSIPFSGHIVAPPAASNALRVYLDGDSYYTYSYASYWNGELLVNSGSFPSEVNLPVVGHLTGVIRKTIPTPGDHSIYVQSSGGTLGTVTTIKAQRRYQIYR